MELYPPELSDDAYRGPIGELVSLLDPHTIADKHALYLTAITLVGHLLDCEGPYKNFPSLATVIVGGTGVGKGQSWSDVYDHIYKPLADAAGVPTEDTVFGFSSGEGIAKEFAGDGIHKIIHLPEFKMFLTSGARKVSTTPQTFQNLYDRADFDNNPKENAFRIRNPRMEMVGHITPEVLIDERKSREWAHDGFLTRLTFCAVSEKPYTSSMEANIIPSDTDGWAKIFNQLTTALANIPISNFDIADGEVMRLLTAHKDRVRAASEPFKAATNRYTTQLIRLALIVAATTGSRVISADDLAVADKWIRRSHQTMDWVFGFNEPDEDEQRVLDQLLESDGQELSRSQVRKIFNGHKSTRAIEYLKSSLIRQGKITSTTRSTGGAPSEIWRIK
jgi:hypothetical protein